MTTIALSFPQDRPWRRQTLLAVPYVVALGLIACACLAARIFGIPMSVLTRDPVTSLDGPFYTGWLSAAGAVGWWSGAAVSLFAAAHQFRGGRSAAFLLASGLLTALLGADDLLLLHDGLMPHALQIGERVVLGGYALLFSVYLVTFRRALLAAHPGTFVAALLFFMLSIVVDKGLLPVAEANRHLAEDGAKLMGIFGWSGFFIAVAFRAMSPATALTPKTTTASVGSADRPAPAPAADSTAAPAPLPPLSPGRFALPSSRVLAWWLWCAIALLLAAHVAGQAVRFGVLEGSRVGVIDRFDMDVESNCPSWYAAALMLLAGGLVTGIGLHNRSRRGDAAHWLALGGMFAFLSLDEATQLHEKLIPPLRRVLGEGGLLYYPWIVPAGALVLLVAIIYRPFLHRLPRAVGSRLVLAGVVYVAGALVMEALSGWHARHHGVDNFSHALLIGAEEALELAGLTIFICAATQYAGGESDPLHDPSHAVPIIPLRGAFYTDRQPAASTSKGPGN